MKQRFLGGALQDLAVRQPLNLLAGMLLRFGAVLSGPDLAVHHEQARPGPAGDLVQRLAMDRVQI